MSGKSKKVRYCRPHFSIEEIDDLAQSLNDWVKDLSERKEFGLLGDWCFENGFNPKYFKRWADKHEGFKQAYENAKAWQEHIVVRGALRNSLNSRFAQFFLSCVHHWAPKDANQEKLDNLKTGFDRFVKHMEGSEEDEEDEMDQH